MTPRGVGGLAVVAVVGAVALGGFLLLRTDAPPPSATGPLSDAVAPSERIRVEVLNAGGVSGLAKAARDDLRDAGFDVVDFRNAETMDTTQEASVVLDRVGKPEMAEAVANALGIGNVRSEPDPNLYVDVSVRLGSVWQPQSKRR